MMKKWITVVVMCMFVFLEGCAVGAASLAGYMDMKMKYAKPYNEYKAQAEKANQQRQSQGQATEPVKDFNAWIKDQPLTNNQIKVLSNLAIISGPEAKEIREREALRKAETQSGQNAASTPAAQ